MKEFSTFLIGIGFGMIVLLITLDNQLQLASKATVAIEQCKKELPRNQFCRLTAIPKN